MKKDSVIIDFDFFYSQKKSSRKLLNDASKAFGKFLQKKIKIMGED